MKIACTSTCDSIMVSVEPVFQKIKRFGVETTDPKTGERSFFYWTPESETFLEDKISPLEPVLSVE